MSAIKNITKIDDKIEITQDGTAVFTVWVAETEEFQFSANPQQIDELCERLSSIARRVRDQNTDR